MLQQVFSRKKKIATDNAIYNAAVSTDPLKHHRTYIHSDIYNEISRLAKVCCSLLMSLRSASILNIREAARCAQLVELKDQ